MGTRLFSFPDTVNEVAARTVASGVVVMVVIALSTRQLWLSAVLAAGFLARVASGPRFSPLGLLATRVIAPRLSAHARAVPGPPKRFAQAMGATFSLGALALWLSGYAGASALLLGALGLAATLEAVFALCLGCQVFALLMRAGVIPESVCLECADLSRVRTDLHRTAAGH